MGEGKGCSVDVSTFEVAKMVLRSWTRVPAGGGGQDGRFVTYHIRRHGLMLEDVLRAAVHQMGYG